VKSEGKRIVPILAIVAALGIGVPTRSFAQDTAGTSRPQAEPQPSAQDHPAAAGENPAKPTHGFFYALGHNLGDDVKHVPRRNSAYWLAAGGALALAVHPKDNSINAHLVNSSSDGLWVPGHVIGSTPVLLGSAFGAYIVGRVSGTGWIQHLGMDEIEATLLSEAFSEGIKVAVRRQRPVQVDGNQSRTYSFPSGHATLTFAAATVLQQHLGYKAAIPTYAVASYVAMSRLHDNRHFASDVIFGASLGIVVGRSVTWHGRNFYASPMLLPDGGGIQIAMIR
jgi:membrane-associated phospholipid phosphatase